EGEREAAVEREVRDQADDADKRLSDESGGDRQQNRPDAEEHHPRVDERTLERDSRCLEGWGRCGSYGQTFRCGSAFEIEFAVTHFFPARLPVRSPSSNIIGAAALPSPMSSMTFVNVSAKRRRSWAGILSSTSMIISCATGGDFSAMALPVFVRLRT